MCGIVGGEGAIDHELVARLAHRGPDARGTWQGARFWLGHTRLAILDLDRRSDQPFRRANLVLVYNGELWNWRELRAELEAEGERFETEGDTEVVAAALSCWGERALSRLEGMFAIAWTDDDGHSVRIARDRHGEVPLHVQLGADDVPVAFASEAKALSGRVEWLEPGTVVHLTSTMAARRRWYEVPRFEPTDDVDGAARAVRLGIERGVREREVSDVGFCLLVSGGIDSSAIAFHAAERHRDLQAYVAVGGCGAPADVRCARELAGVLGLKLHEVEIPRPTAEDLADVVRAIEMPHKAQVEIGWACVVLARRIRADGHRVVLSGEGSDELWASYGMSYHGIKKQGWHGYRRALFASQHRKNFARCNKAFMREGVECRLPFLSTGLVELGLNLPEGHVRDGSSKPKAVLQRAYRGMLPDRIVDRQKMTFQDGVGLQKACATAVADPQRFYRAEHARNYGGMQP